MKSIQFFKYSGNGNDFIILDHPAQIPSASVIQQMCHRHNGIGADGVLVLSSQSGVDGRMRIFNADGGEAEMCANGLRCLFTHVDSQSSVKKESYLLATMNGIYQGHRRQDSFAIEMSEIKEKNRYQSPFQEYARSFFINTGVPHLILLGNEILKIDIPSALRKYRYHPVFPTGSNVSLVEVTDMDLQKAYVRTYERGVEGETYSCGTGLTATSQALAEWFGWKGTITLETKGGEHKLELGEKILFSGWVKFCFQGEYQL